MATHVYKFRFFSYYEWWVVLLLVTLKICGVDRRASRWPLPNFLTSYFFFFFSTLFLHIRTYSLAWRVFSFFNCWKVHYISNPWFGIVCSTHVIYNSTNCGLELTYWSVSSETLWNSDFTRWVSHSCIEKKIITLKQEKIQFV